MLILAFTRSAITAAQWGILKTVLASACAVVAAFVPLKLDVKFGNWLSATGAGAVFAIVFFLSPLLFLS